MKKRALSGVLVLAAVAVFAACERADPPPAAEPGAPAPGAAPAPVGAQVELPEGVTQAMVTEGQQIFNNQICFTCHGQNGVGGPLGPAMTDQDWIHIDGSYDSIVEIIRTGVQNPQQYTGIMPPMGGANLTDDQVRAVAAYVYSLSRGG